MRIDLAGYPAWCNRDIAVLRGQCRAAANLLSMTYEAASTLLDTYSDESLALADEWARRQLLAMASEDTPDGKLFHASDAQFPAAVCLPARP